MTKTALEVAAEALRRSKSALTLIADREYRTGSAEYSTVIRSHIPPIDEALAAIESEAASVPEDRERLAQDLTAPCWELAEVVPYELAVRAAAALRLPVPEEIETMLARATAISGGIGTSAEFARDAATLLHRCLPTHRASWAAEEGKT